MDLAPSLTMGGIQAALEARQVFATRSPTLALLLAGNDHLMGARLHLHLSEPLELQIWCDDPAAATGWSRLELWTNGATLVEAWETHGRGQLSRRSHLAPRNGGEHWFVIKVLRQGAAVAYSSPIWATWTATTSEV